MGKIHKKRCVICERVFDASKSNAKTCSGACRAKLFRQRRGNVVKAQAKTIESQRRFNLDLLHRILKDAYERGEREINMGRDLDPFLSRKDLKDEKSVGIFEFSVRKIEGKTGVYTIVKKY
jgi:hypothetical protein